MKIDAIFQHLENSINFHTFSVMVIAMEKFAMFYFGLEC